MSGLFTPPRYRGSGTTLLAETLERARRRAEWNDRFGHWEKPASVSEEGTIDRAQWKIWKALSQSPWLVSQGVAVQQQGSYYNNTNVRTEADLDLRLQHPAVHTEYADNVSQLLAARAMNYGSWGLSYNQIFAAMRNEAITHLSNAFGPGSLDVGKKAIRVKGITGSRAEVDVVPCVTHHRVVWSGVDYVPFEGTAILGTDGHWTINYPDHHRRNGVAKRERTARRFKRTVRIFKRLRADMEGWGWPRINAPSYLIECLIHVVEDEYFVVDGDDPYGRVRRIAQRMQLILGNPAMALGLREINGIKPLFGQGQAWTLDDARTFTDAVVVHLGDA